MKISALMFHHKITDHFISLQRPPVDLPRHKPKPWCHWKFSSQWLVLKGQILSGLVD